MEKSHNCELKGCRRSFLIWILVWSFTRAAGLAQPSAAPRSNPALEQLVRRLESSYRNVGTLRAAFTQTYIWGERKRIESGTVYFARGGLMRWDYDEPTKKLFLADGKKVYLYIPDERQLTRFSLKSSGDIRVPFRLILSRFELRKIFSKIEFADENLKREPSDVLLRAFPKRGQEQDFQNVLIEVDPAFDIRRLVILSTDRSAMEFMFDRVERNLFLNPALFHFNPPPGTEIIEQ